jgi:hypothetical protein
MTEWLGCDGPAGAEQRIRSTHRAIEIREKRRRGLSSHPAGLRHASPPSAITHWRAERILQPVAQRLPIGVSVGREGCQRRLFGC